MSFDTKYKIAAGIPIIASIILLILLFAPSNAPPAPSGDCYGFSGDYPVVSANPCLQAPYTADIENSTIQAMPNGWSIVNILENADGVRDEFTARARITANGFGLTFELHNGVTGIDGQWGYEQTIEFEPGCYLWKISGHNGINDPPHDYNFTIAAYFDGVEISQQIIPAQTGFELIYPFEVTAAGDYSVRWLVQALWGTAGHGSKIDILGAGVLAVEPEYCAGLE